MFCWVPDFHALFLAHGSNSVRPIPTLAECRHRRFARRLIAVRRCPVLMIAVSTTAIRLLSRRRSPSNKKATARTKRDTNGCPSRCHPTLRSANSLQSRPWQLLPTVG
jgi:hypothetical protein